MKQKKLIIWDWNGTLLNDMHICVESINRLLHERKKPAISINTYKEIFTFPVKDYYIAAGFDFSNEPFDIPALQFMELYTGRLKNIGLYPESKNILEFFRNKRITQAVLSAMEHELLLRTIREKGIEEYFQEILGIEDHFANGKAHQGWMLVKMLGIDPSEALFIGDTLHDHEVALEIGCECILVSHGHQSHERLITTGRKVIINLMELTSLF